MTYLFHDHSQDGEQPCILSCKLPAVTRETKLTLSIALNPKSKLTLECDTNFSNRNARACLIIHYRQPQQGEIPVISLMLFRRHEVGVRGWGNLNNQMHSKQFSGGLVKSLPKATYTVTRNSSGDELPNVNFLWRHRTCRGQRLRSLSRLPNSYYN